MGPSHNCGMTNEEEWSLESGMTEGEGTRSYQQSGRDSPNGDDEESSHPQTVLAASGLIVPESYEEQMMLAMAVSLAEARVPPGVTWH